MLRAPQFMIRFANYKMNVYEKQAKNYPSTAGICLKASRIATKAVRDYERGLITVDGAMRLILDSATYAEKWEE